MDKIRIMLVDDHQVVREGLRRMLELEPDMEVVAEAANGQEALSLARAFSPEIVLMDIKMPGLDGIEATRLLKQENPQCKVIMLTLYDEHLPSAILTGADGYLLKDLRRENLSRAIREAREGRTPIYVSLERRALGGLVTGAQSSQALGERELEVLRLVAKGGTSVEIAQHMAMSEATIKRTLRQIYEKLGARNRSEAVAEAMKRNLI